ncbi:MAG: hypothetical protein IT372_09550, partial [Polyangiaceae bacterium]|nr:hypothetical protein [Polyangiaceae bacterium]
MKDRTRLLSQLASLVGDLRPGPSASAADLVAVQRLAARALLDGAIDAAPPSGPMEPGADIDALAALIDEAAGEGAELLVSRRSLPVFHAGLAGSVPPWAEGRAVERTVGPFQDRLGRHIWIDLFRIVRQLRLVRRAGAEPFLTLPISLAAGPAPSPARTTYDLPAGSIWVASRLLAPGAPASSFTGLRIRGGRLQFTQPIAISGNEVVVPAAVQCLLELELEPESAPAGSGDGADARAAQSEPPRRVTLHVGALGATFPSVGPGRVAAYGYPVHLSQTPGAVEYLPDLQRLAVPLAADARTFQVRSVASRLFQPSGEAPILRAAWGLPVAVSSPASLGDASGSGNLLLWIDKGLHAKWLDQPNEVALGPSVLMADPAQLSLAAPAASAQGEQQRLALWSGDAPSTALLRYEQRFALRFSSQAAGHEALLAGASLTATMDRPVDVRGARLTLRARDAQVTLLVGPQGAFALVEAALEIPAGLARLGLAIRNALFVVAPPSTLRLLTGLDAANRDTGACVLAFRRRALVPTLPDPYAANAGPLRATLDQPGGELLSLVTWRPASPVRLDFILPAGTAAPAPAGAFTGLVAQPIDGGAPDLLAARAFAGRDVLSGAIKALGGALAFERRRALILLDVSTNTDQFGVAVARTGRDDDGGSRALAVQDLYLQAGSVELLTLPAVQWEAVITPSDPNDPTFPRRLGFATSGVPTVIDVPSVRLVAVHPRAALDTLVDNFALPAPRPARARFTLPFGMIASAVLEKPGGATTRGAELRYNRPRTSDLEGGHQLSIQAVDTSLPAAASPSLSGFTAQLPVGQPGWRSALGDAVTITFNSYLGAGGFRPLVPVTRLDLSGYGESLFSDWRNPYPDPVAVSQARFDVLVGRTAREVVQTRSYLYPYAVQVVRTITIERRNNAVVQRRDSGWQPVSDGIYAFPGAPRVETHPGVVKRITNISGIRDTGEIVTIDGIQLAAVRFDGDLELDGAPALVPARDQLGYVQLTAGNLMAPATYARLIEAVGPLGGAVDANLQIGGGGQAMRARRVGVGVTRVMGGPEFVMTAWGSPAFPGGG